MRAMVLAVFCWQAVFCLQAVVLKAASPEPEVQSFITTYCADCHNASDKAGRLDLTSLDVRFDDRTNASTWIKIHDRVKAGEMPPRDAERPSEKRAEQFTGNIAKALKDFEQARYASQGRSVQRRLNRYEYENAIRDLLQMPWLQIMGKLPQDGEAFRYNKIGEALDVSHIQMARYMSAADYALRHAIALQLDHPETQTNRYYARDEFGLRNFLPREGSTIPDRLSFPVLDSQAQPEVRYGRAPITSPETREREAIGKVTSTFSDAGGYSWNQFRAPVGGRYKLRFAGYSIWVSPGGIGRWFFDGTGAEKAPVFHLPLYHRPNLDEVWPGRRHEPIGVYATSSGQKRPLGEFDFYPESSVQSLEVTLNANEVIQTDGSRLFRTRVNGTDEQYVNPLAQADGMPGYAVQWLEVEGPLYDESLGAGYRLMFGDLPIKKLDSGIAGVILDTPQPAGGGRGGRGGRGGGPAGARGARGARGAAPVRVPPTRVEVVSEQPAADAERLLRQFMQRAFRRPVEESEIQRLLQLFREQYALGYGFAKSMVATYTAVLASPGFVFIEEQPGKLDDYALATRLSLFLWNSEPDSELRSLADRKQLHDPANLLAQTERLLDDPKSRRMIDAFTDYWLDLRKIDDTSPSPTLYNDYELDDPLKHAAVEETRLFVSELIHSNLPARNIVDSRFTFLNERLANHYGIPNVVGANMRKVELPDDSPRGGLMTQASVLKVTANGTTTSPVIRGLWITERILGMEIPPPPPVPSVEPDIRGAVTIRQQLDKHRNDPSCAVCHSKIDPPGFALESFDVMGGFRERYRAIHEGVPPARGIGMNGQAFAFHYALPVETHGNLPDGRTFQNVRELKQLLLKDERSIARNIIRQLMIYATGAPIGFSDRETVEQILTKTESSQYGMRDIVRAIVATELFQSK